MYPTGRDFAKSYSVDFTNTPRISGRVLLKAGSYGSKLAAPGGTGSQSQISMHSEQANTPFTYQAFESLGLSAAGSEGVVGKHFTVDCRSGADAPSVHVSELHLQLISGFSLNDGGADAVADGACLWTKVYGVGNAVDAGATLAGVWIDHQLGISSIGAGAKEYGIFVTAGGTVPTAIIGTKTTSGGWDAFVAFQDNAAPVGAAVSASSGSDASIKVTVAGTPYYIPLYDSLSS
jgi:hypothetical protein